MNKMVIGLLLGCLAVSCSFYDSQEDCAGRFQGRILGVQNGLVKVAGEATPLGKVFPGSTPVVFLLDERGTADILKDQRNGDEVRFFFRMDQINPPGVDALVHILYR